jgi:hypothetical protein
MMPRIPLVFIRLLLLAVVGVLALNALTFLAASWWLIRFPFALDYGEGIVYWQAAHVFDLAEAYHPIDQFPFIVFHYPPVYHVLSRVAALLVGGDLLVGGRFLSWLMAVATTILAGAIASTAVTRRETDADSGAGPDMGRVVAAVTAPLLVLQLATLDWIPLMRVDITAVFFTLLGLFVFLRVESVAGRLAAAVLFVVALFSKQTMVAAPVAAVVTLALTGSLAQAVALSGVMIVLGVTTLGVLTWSTHGEFVRHVFLYNRNPFVLRQLIDFSLKNVSELGVVAGLALIVPFQMWRPIDRGQRAKLCLAINFVVAGLVCVTAGKAGAAMNYFLEWNIACCILAAVAVGELLPHWSPRRIELTGLVVLLMLGVFGVAHLPRSATYVTMLRGRDSALNARATAATHALAEIKAVRGPVLSEDMLLLTKAHKDIPWEPAIITQLAATGVFDESPAIARVERRWFDRIVVRSLAMEPTAYPSGHHPIYSERMRAAIEEAYEVRVKLPDGYTVMQPRFTYDTATQSSAAPPPLSR